MISNIKLKFVAFGFLFSIEDFSFFLLFFLQQAITLHLTTLKEEIAKLQQESQQLQEVKEGALKPIIESTDDLETLLRYLTNVEDIQMLIGRKINQVEGEEAAIMLKNLCLVCQQNPKEIMFQPCNHLCVCSSCDEQYNFTVCPRCKHQIDNRIAPN